MKAIQQLVAYFEERGQLSRRQLDDLTAKGYWSQYTAADMRSLENKIGQSFHINASGNTIGPLWGTDIYTSDSNLGTACVHAGVLKPGENGVVKVTIVRSLPVFTGSTRHGVTSSTWTPGWPGAFSVESVGIFGDTP
jgi:hypothetical protein